MTMQKLRSVRRGFPMLPALLLVVMAPNVATAASAAHSYDTKGRITSITASWTAVSREP